MPHKVSPGTAGLSTSLARFALLTGLLLYFIAAVIDGAFFEFWALFLIYFLITATGVFFLTDKKETPLDNKKATVVVVSALAGAATALAVPVSLGSGVWVFYFSVYVTGLLIVRGNTLVGSLAALGLFLVGVIALILGSVAQEACLALMIGAILVTVVASVWRFILVSLYQKERILSEKFFESHLATEIATQRTSLTRSRLKWVSGLVSDDFKRIANGEEIDEEFRKQLGITEATIRDALRSPGLQNQTLITGIIAARNRGIEVSLLGDNEKLLDDQVAAEMAKILAALKNGSVTIRAAASARGGSVSMLVNTKNEFGTQLAERYEF